MKESKNKLKIMKGKVDNHKKKQVKAVKIKIMQVK